MAADILGGWTCCVEQGHYGHGARKATWLYTARIPGSSLPELAWGPSENKDLQRLDQGFHSREERLDGWPHSQNPPRKRFRVVAHFVRTSRVARCAHIGEDGVVEAAMNHRNQPSLPLRSASYAASTPTGCGPGRGDETYTARWEDTGKTIYVNEPHGNLFGHLPLGSMPIKFDGDGWNNAIFGCEGRRIVVTRDTAAAKSADPRTVFTAEKVGKVIDVRAGRDGEPMFRKLTSTLDTRIDGALWFYWYWLPEQPTPEGHRDCGYSGEQVEGGAL